MNPSRRSRAPDPRGMPSSEWRAPGDELRVFAALRGSCSNPLPRSNSDRRQQNPWHRQRCLGARHDQRAFLPARLRTARGRANHPSPLASPVAATILLVSDGRERAIGDEVVCPSSFPQAITRVRLGGVGLAGRLALRIGWTEEPPRNVLQVELVRATIGDPSLLIGELQFPALLHVRPVHDPSAALRNDEHMLSRSCGDRHAAQRHSHHFESEPVRRRQPAQISFEPLFDLGPGEWMPRFHGSSVSVASSRQEGSLEAIHLSRGSSSDPTPG